MKPNVAILVTDGINCDMETYFAFEQAGGNPKYVHINELFSGSRKLDNFQILALPGGFSYGDDILSGKILANQIIYRLKDSINDFLYRDTLILGICNGFQVLVRTGILPFFKDPAYDATLIFNDSNKFQSEWVELKVEKSKCFFTANMYEETFHWPIAHAEGKFVLRDTKALNDLIDSNQIVLRYNRINPNGSFLSIAGICDPTGRVFGLMPHPERDFLETQNPNWRRDPKHAPVGKKIFLNAINFFS